MNTNYTKTADSIGNTAGKLLVMSFLCAAALPLAAFANPTSIIASSPENISGTPGNNTSTTSPPLVVSSPPPPTNQCPLHSLQVDSRGNFGDGLSVNYDASAPSCLAGIIDNAITACSAMTRSEINQCLRSVYGYGGSFDDCVVLCQLYTLNPNNPTGRGYGGIGSGDFTFYFDDNCDFDQVRSSRGLDYSCGSAANISYYYSPISLIWEDGLDIEETVSFTSFPLNPKKSGKWYEWKASEKAPLLVYDPEHSGEITSAFQVFGEWAFGGKSVASLRNKAASLEPRPWNNGYEALGSLDADQNGKVDGEELAPLGLWFDKNRDGQAQHGEVRELAETGVTALYYSYDISDPLTKNIHASVGYERVVDNRTIKGASVDWYGAEAATKMELLNKQYFQNDCEENSFADSAQELPSNLGSSPAQRDTATGAWQWEMDNNALSDAQAKGILAIVDSGDGEIYGKTFLEAPFTREIEGYSGMLRIIPIQGTKDISKDGRTRLNFTATQKNGARAASTAYLSADGEVLKGKTDTVIKRSGKQVKFSYTWTARKVQKR